MGMRIEEFADYLRLERNYSVRTCSHYADSLRCFEAFFRGLDAGLTWETVDADVISCWLEHMMDGGLRAVTVNNYLSAVKSFYRFALKRGYV